MSSNKDIPQNNGAVLNIWQITKAVMSSAAEAELGALFINAKLAVPIHTTLVELGHPQPKTPIQTDNSTAQDFLTNRINPNANKSMVKRFHWLRYRDVHRQFWYYWRLGPIYKATRRKTKEE